MELKNEFSWSKSRDDLFNSCKRKYYYDKYGSWNGWKLSVDKRIREIYILKNLSNRYIWIGKTVHEIIKYFLIQLKAGKQLTLSHLIFRLRKKLEEDFEESKSGIYHQFPKKCGLVEHEYNNSISPNEWEELYKKAEKCIMNFYNSDILNDIKNVDINNWIFLEDFLSFDFEGTKVYLCIDFAIKNDENKIILYDWKTGKERYVEMDIQLACYALYVMEKFNLKPEEIIVKKYNVSLDKEDQFNIDQKTIEEIKIYMRKSIDKMKNILVDKKNNIADEKNFPKTSNIRNCLGCNFKKVCEIV